MVDIHFCIYCNQENKNMSKEQGQSSKQWCIDPSHDCLHIVEEKRPFENSIFLSFHWHQMFVSIFGDIYHMMESLIMFAFI
jgi:hypothetical protein